MKVYVKTGTIESSDYSPTGKLVEYTVTEYSGPFEYVRDAVNWALVAGYENFEIMEFDE